MATLFTATESLADFTGYEEYGNCEFNLDAAAKHSGTYGFKYIIGTTPDACAWFIFADQTEIYVRAYVYVSSTLRFNNAWATFPLIRFRMNETDTIALFGLFGNGSEPSVPEAWMSKYSTEDAQGSTTRFSFDEWHCIEMRFLSAATGGIEVWTDGVKDTALSNINQDTSALDIDQVFLGNYTDGVSTGGYVYFDDVIGATTYTGPIAAGGSSYTVACADGIVFDDSGRKIATFNVSAADGLALGDGGKGPASFLSAGTDSIALNDLSSMLRFFLKGAADGVAFSEAADRAATFSRIASDAVAFGENAGAFAAYLAAAADSIALGDESFYAVVGAIEVFAADGIALQDASLVSATFQVAAAESILLGDSASRVFTVRLIAEDGIALGDTVSVQVDLDAKAIDGITVHDAAQSLAAYLAAATDGIALQDISISITGNLATGILSVTFTTKKSVITLTGKKSLVAMLGKKSNVSID